MSSIFRLKDCLPKQRPDFSIDEECAELRERRQAVVKCIESVAMRNGAQSQFRDCRAPSTQVAWHYPPELLLPWSQLGRQVDISRKRVKGLETTGYRQGAIPAQWMGCLQSILVDDLIIEIWDGQRWNCIQDPSAGDSWAWRTNLKEAAYLTKTSRLDLLLRPIDLVRSHKACRPLGSNGLFAGHERGILPRLSISAFIPTQLRPIIGHARPHHDPCES